jgi:transcriptional antiterminator NusG
MNEVAAGAAPQVNWYALWTRSRQERVTALRLASLGISHYLPLQFQIRQWSDRKQPVETPLFPGYVFVQMDLAAGQKLDVLKAQGVVGFVGNSSGPLPIPESQIAFVRKVTACRAECTSGPLMKQGDPVRVVGGLLAGLEGVLVRFGSDSKLVISIEMIQRSVAVTISEKDVQPLHEYRLN